MGKDLPHEGRVKYKSFQLLNTCEHFSALLEGSATESNEEDPVWVGVCGCREMWNTLQISKEMDGI